MSKLTTGMLIGGIVGISSIAVMNLDNRNMRRMKRKGKNIINKAEDLMEDIREFM